MIDNPQTDRTVEERVARHLAARDWLTTEDRWDGATASFRAEYLAAAREVIALVQPAVLPAVPVPPTTHATDRAAVLLIRTAELITQRANDLWSPGSPAHTEMLADAAELRRMAAEAQQPDTEPGADLIEDYLRFLRGKGPEPDLSDLSPEQRDAITGRFEIVRALADRDPNLPPLERDPVARRLGLHAADEAPQPEPAGVRQPDTETLLGLIRDFLDPDPCQFDHHGYCQAHGYLGGEPHSCPHGRARKLLTALNDEPAAEAQRPDTETRDFLMRAHVALAEQAGRDQAALVRVRRLHDNLAAENDLASPDDVITRGAAAKRIATALDGWNPAGLPGCDVEFEGRGRCAKPAGHRPPGSDDPHVPDPTTTAPAVVQADGEA